MNPSGRGARWPPPPRVCSKTTVSISLFIHRHNCEGKYSRADFSFCELGGALLLEGGALGPFPWALFGATRRLPRARSVPHERSSHCNGGAIHMRKVRLYYKNKT
jgi:hypothetical protein